MAINYVITFTDPVVPSIVVAPGEINKTTLPITLIGQGATSYGKEIAENFVHLLENFAFDTAPSNPVKGMLWYDTDADTLKVYDGTDWKGSNGITVSGSTPSSPVEGDLWYDTSVPQLKIYNGSAFVSVADRYLLLAGGTLTGALILAADPVTALGAATKQYVDNTTVSSTDLAGDSMAGPLTLPGVPTLTNHAATKGYVDTNFLALNGGTRTVTDEIIINTSGVTSGPGNFGLVVNTLADGNAGGIRIVTGDTNDDQFGILVQDSAGFTKFSLSSVDGDGVFSGTVTVATPTANGHAATKLYVDNAVSSLTGNIPVINPGSGSEKNGDIQVIASPLTISIFAVGVWRQVYPAVYS